MATGYDGSIVLTTEVDTDGIKLGAKNIKDVVSATDKSIDKLGAALSSELSKGNVKTAQLISNFKKAALEVQKQADKVDELKERLQGLKDGEIDFKSKGTEKLQSDFDKVIVKVNETKQEIDELHVKLEELQQNAFIAPDSGEVVFSGQQQAEFEKLNARLNELEPTLDAAKQKAKEFGDALRKASGRETQAEIEKTRKQLSEAEAKLQTLTDKAKIAGKKVEESTESVSSKVSHVNNSVNKLSKKIFSLAKSALIIYTLRSAFSSLRNSIGSALMSNEEFRKSLYTLQAALWTLAAPLYDIVLPTLQKIMKCLTMAILYVATFVAFLSNKSIKDLIKNAEALQKNVEAYDNVAESSKKATKSLADFDDISILQDNSRTETKLNYGSVADGFKELESLLDNGDLEKLQNFEDWLNENRENINMVLEALKFAAYVVAIKAVIDAITNLISKFTGKDKALDIQRGKLQLETVASYAFCTALAYAAVKTGLFEKALNALEEAFNPMPQAEGKAEKGALAYSTAADSATQSTTKASSAMVNAKDKSEELGTEFASASEKIVDSANRTTAPIINEKKEIGELGTVATSTAQSIGRSLQGLTPQIVSSKNETDSLNTAFLDASASELLFGGMSNTTKEKAEKLNSAIGNLVTVYDRLTPSIKGAKDELWQLCDAISAVQELVGDSTPTYVSNVANANPLKDNEFLNKVVNGEFSTNVVAKTEMDAEIYIEQLRNHMSGAGAFDMVTNAVTEGAKRIGQNLTNPDFWAQFGMAWENFFEKMLPFITSYATNLAMLSPMATGGIVPYATPILAGEAGKEAILPLENNTEWMDLLADRISARNGTQTVREEHYYLNQTELMKILYKLAKGGERLNGTSLVKQGGI